MKAYSWHMLYIKGRLLVDTSYHIKWSSQLIHFIIYITICFLCLFFSNFLKSMNNYCFLELLVTISHPSFWLIIVFLTRVPWWGPLVEQELPSLPVHLSSCPILVGFVASEFMPNVSGFVASEFMFNVSGFVASEFMPNVSEVRVVLCNL